MATPTAAQSPWTLKAGAPPPAPFPMQMAADAPLPGHALDEGGGVGVQAPFRPYVVKASRPPPRGHGTGVAARPVGQGHGHSHGGQPCHGHGHGHGHVHGNEGGDVPDEPSPERMRQIERGKAAIRKTAVPLFSLLFGLVYWTVMVHCVDPWTYLDVYNAAALLVVQALAVPVAVFYMAAAFTSPGYVEDGWDRLFVPPGGSGDDPERTFPVVSQMCPRCTKPRPARAHHCKVCRRCVLKYDHHCYWLNNCVGFRNYKFFISFLAWLFVATSTAVVMVVYRVVSGPSLGGGWPLAAVAATLQVSAVGAYLSYGHLRRHVRLLASGQSTIEELQNRPMWEFAESRGVRVRRTHMYDFGTWRNVTSVMGESPAQWLFPVLYLPQTPRHQWAGYCFEVSKDAIAVQIERQRQLDNPAGRTHAECRVEVGGAS